jgi:hypothetical protein
MPEYDAFLSQVTRTLGEFIKRSDKQFVTLSFTLPNGISWTDIRRSPNLLYKYVRIRHELQLADDRQRAEQESRDEAEKVRATRDRLAQETVREQKRQAAAEKIKKLAIKIAGETMFWTYGMVTGKYVNGDFQLWYAPVMKHGNTDLAVEQANAAEHRQKLERALWDAYHQPGAVLTIYSIPSAPVPVPDPDPAPPALDSTASEPDAEINPGLVLYRQGLAGYEAKRQAVMTVTEPAAAFLEAFNSFDPVNLAIAPLAPLLAAGVVRKGWKVAGTLVKGSKTRRIISKGSFGRIAKIEGDMGRLLASQREGHHVYEYLDMEGNLLYVGKSGGVLGPKNADDLAANWLDRLSDDHIKSDWILEARSVRVTTEMSEQEMWALEHVLIPGGANNIQQGQYYSMFKGGDVGINAAYALKRPQAVFSIEVFPAGPQ